MKYKITILVEGNDLEKGLMEKEISEYVDRVMIRILEFQIEELKN